MIENSIISIDNRYFKGQNCLNVKWKFHGKVLVALLSGLFFTSVPFAMQHTGKEKCVDIEAIAVVIAPRNILSHPHSENIRLLLTEE